MNPWVYLLLVFLGCGLAGFVVRRLIRVFMTVLRQPPHLRQPPTPWKTELRARINGQVIELPPLVFLEHEAKLSYRVGSGRWFRVLTMPVGKDGTPARLVMKCDHGTTYYYPIELEMKSE